jgi:hypothetical protein
MSLLRAAGATALLCLATSACQINTAQSAASVPAQAIDPFSHLGRAELELDSYQQQLLAMSPADRATLQRAARSLLNNCLYSRATATMVLALHTEATGPEEAQIRPVLDRLYRVYDLMGIGTLPQPSMGDGLFGYDNAITLDAAMITLAEIRTVNSNMTADQKGRIDQANDTLYLVTGGSWPLGDVVRNLHLALEEGTPNVPWIKALLGLQLSLGC